MIPIIAAGAAAGAAARRSAMSAGNIVENSAMEVTILEADKVFVMSIPYVLVKTADNPGREIMAVELIKETEQQDIGLFRKKMIDVSVTKEVTVPINKMINRKLPVGAVAHSITIDWYHREVDVVYTIGK